MTSIIEISLTQLQEISRARISEFVAGIKISSRPVTTSVGAVITFKVLKDAQRRHGCLEMTLVRKTWSDLSECAL